MSYVTNLLLHLSNFDDERIEEVNQFFLKSGFKPLVAINDPSLPRGWYGGNRYFEAHIYVGAFNYLDLNGFVAHLQSISWEYPEHVQLFINEQYDFEFRILKIVPEGPSPRENQLIEN